jgi:hypothetical protein
LSFVRGGGGRGTNLVVVIKVYPATQAFDGVAPLVTITHNDSATLSIVLLEAHLHDGLLAGDVELLVNLVFDGNAVRVPAESPFNMIAFHGPVSGNDILDGGREEMAVVRQTGREGWPIIKGIPWPTLGELDLIRQS